MTIDILSMGFAQRALLAAALVSAGCAALGVFLVLRRLSLLGDGLAHASFAGVAAGLLAGVNPFAAAAVFAVICSHWIFRLSEKTKMSGDAAIGIAGAAGVAAAAAISSAAGGFNSGLMTYLFGSVLTVTGAELAAAAAMTAAALGMIAVFYNELVCAAFEGEQARVLGVKTGALNAMFAAVAAGQIVAAVKVAGVMLTPALIVIPASAALLVARGFKTAIALACIIAAAGAVGGILAAFALNIPAGAAITLADLLLLAAAYAYARISGRRIRL
ncbi:MAG: metal ABC transporter permease [Elusimicrobiales bacterium]